jgi:mono/diheme cytochrome c family protein
LTLVKVLLNLGKMGSICRIKTTLPKAAPLAILIGLFTFSNLPLPADDQSKAPRAADVASHKALLDKYCVTCHNDRAKTAGLSLGNMDLANVDAGAEIWEKVSRKLRTGAMPPAGAARPDSNSATALATYLETSLDSAAAAKPNPGRPAVHRLNRAEYNNAIRDLLALDIEKESQLPADDSGYGFDNIGDVLSVSPMLLDRYLTSARRVVRLALGDPTMSTPMATYAPPRLSSQNDRASDELPFGARGGIAVHHTFPVDGEYVLKINLQKSGRYIRGYGEQHQLDVRLDGERLKLFTIGGGPKPPTAAQVEAGLELRIPVKAGARLVGVTFLPDHVVPEGMFRGTQVQVQFAGTDVNEARRDPGIENITIGGPFNAQIPKDSASRRQIFVCYPARAEEEDPCARKILSALANRAYRRPVTEQEIRDLLGLYRAGKTNASFESGISSALQGLLVSGHFLFRMEQDLPKVASGVPYRVSDLDLASRLSFFLWSSIPDEQLLDLAQRNQLHDPAVLEKQTRRMLLDPRSKALMTNFAGQWLLLRSLHSAPVPDTEVYPDFDEDLRNGFQTEMELFLDTNLREDRSVLDLLRADFTFVNERLARHYGISGIYGTRFRRVTLADRQRWGLLGKGAILMVTSFPNRTSPVLRGKWVLDNLLGTPPPPPPPNVPDLKEDIASQHLSMRLRMEQHRANPACASCHARMDPIGFALDNFDGIGHWRSDESLNIWNHYTAITTHAPLDTSGEFPDGSKFQGPAGLRALLLSHPEPYLTTLTEKLLTYGLGRGLEYYDEPTVRKILRDSAAQDYRWSSLILEIVKSPQFLMRTSGDSAVASR